MRLRESEHNAALKDELEKALSVKPVAQWLDILEQAGVPSGPINSVDQVLADQQVNARNMIVSAGSLKMAGNPIKMSGMEGTISTPAPMLGEHTDEVLSELLGLDATTIAALRAAGAVK